MLYFNHSITYCSLKRKSEFEEGSTPKRFYGPPTNCAELQKLGHTLNGYYLIKGKKISNANGIQVVYCQFDQPPGENKKGNFKFKRNLLEMNAFFIEQ